MVAWVDYVIGAAREKRHALRDRTQRRRREPTSSSCGTPGSTGGSGASPISRTWTTSPTSPAATSPSSPPRTSRYTAATLAAIARILGRPRTQIATTSSRATCVEAWRPSSSPTTAPCVRPSGRRRARARVRSRCPTDPATTVADRLVVDGPRRRHPPQYRLPRHAVPAAGPRRQRVTSTSPTSCCCQDTPPSWLTMIDRGATTIWEHWEGDRCRRRRARVAQPLQQGRSRCRSSTRYVAGIQLLDDGPGLPALPRRRRSPAAGSRGRRRHIESPYGRIESSWWTGAAGTTLTVQVPPNTEAEVVSLPDGAETLVGPGRRRSASRSTELGGNENPG